MTTTKEPCDRCGKRHRTREAELKCRDKLRDGDVLNVAGYEFTMSRGQYVRRPLQW